VIQTDPLTGYLMAKLVSREEQKNYENTLHSAINATQIEVAKQFADKADPEEVKNMAFSAAGELIKSKLDRELMRAIGHLAKTLALAAEIGDKSTKSRRKKLQNMAKKAVAYEQIKLGILENALRTVDFEHIAEVLINIGERKAGEVAERTAAAAIGPDDPATF
jgi:hypothetical protein